MSDDRITWQDVRAAGYCLHVGARRWCALHGVSFRQLMSEGIPADVAECIDDEMARKVLEVKRGR
jgi:hypothetical protein